MSPLTGMYSVSYVSAMTECVVDYINFCLENILPTWKVRCFPYNKAWITSDLKKLLNMKKKAIREGDRKLWRTVQK